MFAKNEYQEEQANTVKNNILPHATDTYNAQ